MKRIDWSNKTIEFVSAGPVFLDIKVSINETFAKQYAIFLSVRKAVNIQGYSKLREPIKTRENCYPLIW